MSRLIAALALMLALAAPVHAAEAGLLSQLVGRTFVIPDAQAEPVPMEFTAPEDGVVEVHIAGQTIDRYRFANGAGEHINVSAPDVVSTAAFGPDQWSRSYKGLTITYALNGEGDLVARLSGAVEDWQRPSFVYGHNPAHPDLRERLRAALEAAHAEADRYEGHDHEH
jgi:hypothetical protein